MARSSSSTGSRFASANLNDLYGKQVHPGSGGGTGAGLGSKLRYGHSSHSHGGMLVLARPVRTPPGHHRSKAAPQKLTVPAPVNLPSLRKEHAGNDPSISLVGGSGTSGWKQQQSLADDASTVADGTPGSFRSNGWGLSSSQVHSLEQGPNSADGQLRPGKYTPPAARGPSESPLPIRHGPSPTSSLVLRGEDFPTLRDALPFNPVPQRQRELQQRQRDRQREMKEEQQKLQQLSQNQAEKEQDWSSQLTLHPHVKQDRGPKEDDYKGTYAKENQKPNDLSLRPGPVQYTHASNWAEDERDTSSAFRPQDWEEGPRYSSSQPPPSRTPLYRDERLNNTRRDYVYNRDPGDFGRGRDFGWERDGHFGRNDISRDWRTGAFDRSEVEMGREYNSGRDFRGSGRGQREGHVTRDSFAGRGREGYLRDDFFNRSGFSDRGRFGGRGGFDFGMDFGRLRSPGLVRGMSSHSEDAFMRDFPDLGSVDLRARNKLRKKDEAGDIYFHDPERESFESELERVQKEQEQERLRKVEERERAIELARKEQEERERVAREEEERQCRLEEEVREAAARAEREALEAASKMEEAKRARNAEKQKMQEEEERRKENARKKLMELEERIAKREMEKKQGAPQSETSDRELDAQDDRMPRPLSSSGMSRSRQESPSSRVRSPGVSSAYAVGRDTSRDSERPRFPISWRREPLDSHFSVAQDHEGHREADSYYGNFDGLSGGDVLRKERERTGEKWLANGERNFYSPRSAFTNSNFLDREERWSRRGRDRPFSPPSPTYGSSFEDGVQYGRLRQSLPKQPRVPPPPMRTSLQRQASLKDSQPAGLDDKPELETQIEHDLLDKSFSESEEDSVAGEAGEADVLLAAQQSDKHIVEAEEMVLEGTAAVETSEEEEALELSAVEKHVVETEPTMGEDDTFSEGRSGDLQSLKGLSSENDNLEESVDGEVSEGAQMSAELSELVDSLVVVPKVESGPVAEPQVSSAGELEVPTEEAASQGELASGLQPVRSPSADSAPLLPSPLPTMQPAPGDGKHHVFGQAAYMPPQMPLLEPRPRLQTHPDRPMTLQFGLLPGTSLFQGSVPAIQIGSIQMPLQLHPPIGHHVTHMRPPQFQFGQIAQQPPLMPSFTVHPQAMMQPLNMEGPPGAQPIPGHQFHLQPHPDRTFWAHQYGQPSQLQHNQQPVDARPDKFAAPLNPLQESEARQEPEHMHHSSSGSALEEHADLATSADKDGAGKQERRRPNRRDFKASNHGVHYVRKNSKDGKEMEAELPKQNHSHGDEDDFIEVRSKRQLLNERRGEKEKQNKSKSKFVKAKEQTTPKVKDQLLPKQKNLTKPQVASSKQPVKPDSLRNVSLDPVVGAHQVSLSNPEVGYEKRAKSPQPLQNDSLNTDAAQVGSLSLAGAWGFTKEVVDLQQIQLDEVIDSASAAAKERNAATISSLLAGEKIQFGAVTMPAFVSPVGWRLGSTQPEDFLTSSKDDVASCDKVKPPRDTEDNISNVVDSEAEAEAAASAIAVAAIGSDDFVHNTDQHVPSHGIIGSASKNGSPVASSGTAVRSDDPMSVSLPADLSVDPPLALRGPPHSGQHLASIPGGFPGMEMGNAEQGVGRPPAGPGPNWPGVDSFYGAPPSYTGPFINHGPPIPSIPPQTLVYTNPFGVGQFGQLYMGPLPSVKQPDWKHTPVSSTAVSGMSNTDYGRVLYAQHGNRHLGHDPSVISVVTPPGPFDVYRDVAFQSHWSHIPPHMHNAPGFSMQLRHPPPPFHVQQQQQQQQQQHQQHQQQQLVESAAESNLPTIKVPGDQFPDELGLGDSMSPCSDAASSSVEAPPKAPSPVSALPSATNSSNINHLRTVQSTTARPTIAGYQSPAFSVPVPVPAPAVAAETGASPARRPVEKRTAPGAHYHHHHQQQQQQGVAAKVNPTGWGNQGRKAGGPQGRTPPNERDKSGSSAPVSTKLKQVYVAKPSSSSLGLTSSNETAAAAGSEIFTAEAVQT